MAFEREGRAPELICVMKQPRPDQLVLEENEGLFRRRGVWLLIGKMHFFGMGNSDAGLVTPPPAGSSLQGPSQALLTSPLQPSTEQQEV